MRAAGLFLLGLGITLLIPCGFALANAASLQQVVGFLICTGLIPVPMIVGGIALIRAVEDRSLPPEEESEPDVVTNPEGGPISRTLQRARGFELNRLSWVGWLLLLATFGFVIAEAFVLVHVVENAGLRGQPAAGLVVQLSALPLLLLAIGFFVGVRWLLGLFGVSIFRW